MPETHPVVIPAAGASSRMGRPKPLLDFDGRTALELVLSACRDAGALPAVVVLGAHAEAIRAALPDAGDVVLVVNATWERGQTSSIKAGVAALPGSCRAFFVLPADLPLVGPAEFAALASRMRGAPPGRTIFVAEHAGRRGHPVLLAEAHRGGILALDDATPLRDYVRGRGAEVETVPVTNPGVVMRMNDEEEYRAALEAYRRRG